MNSRAEQNALEDRRVRERLERSSPRGERRADIVGCLNRVSEDDTVLRHGAEGILLGLRNAAQGRARTVGDMNARHDDWLRRSTTAMPVNAGASFGEARLSPERRGPSGSRFEIQPGDPGSRPSRFSWNDKTDPPRRVPQVRDADGNMRGARSTEDGSNDGSDHWQNQGVHNLGSYGYEGEVLSIEDMANRARQKWRSRFF